MASAVHSGGLGLGSALALYIMEVWVWVLPRRSGSVFCTSTVHSEGLGLGSALALYIVEVWVRSCLDLGSACVLPSSLVGIQQTVLNHSDEMVKCIGHVCFWL